MVRVLEAEEFVVVGFGETLPSSLDGPLDPSVIAFNRFGDVDAAQFFEGMIDDPVEECRVPRVREGMQYGRDMRPDRLALGPGSAVQAAVLDDLAVFWGKRVEVGVADPWHGDFSW
jgi:hypothetical protein